MFWKFDDFIVQVTKSLNESIVALTGELIFTIRKHLNTAFLIGESCFKIG